jgi:hypothetical protein
MTTSTVRIPIDLETKERWNGKRYVPAVRASIGPITVVARKSEVAALITEAITNFVTSYETPVTYGRDGGSATVHVLPPVDNAVVEWGARTVSPSGHVRHWSTYTDRDSAHRGARTYIADQTCDPHSGASVNATLWWLQQNGADTGEAREYLRSTAFQRAYRFYAAQGLTDTECHRLGSENADQFLTTFPGETA